MGTENDKSSTYSVSSGSRKMKGRQEFCWGQLFGVVLFCLGIVGGILIGIYVYHGGPTAEVTCKNLPEWPTKKESQQTTSTEIPSTAAKRESFTYAVNNQVQEPYFNYSVTMEIKRNEALIYYMEKAVDMQNTILTGFKATYYASLGYFVDSINNLAGNYKENKTYWQILNSTGPLPVGVSSYIPTDKDNVLFNFTVDINHAK